MSGGLAKQNGNGDLFGNVAFKAIDVDQTPFIIISGNRLPYFNGSIMHKIAHGSAEFRKEGKARGLNVDKLQAALCIIASAAVSITLLALGIKAFI